MLSDIMKTSRVLISVAIISSIFVKECQSCMTKDKIEVTEITKAGSSFFKQCNCEGDAQLAHRLKWVDKYGNEILPATVDVHHRVHTERSQRYLRLIFPHTSKNLSGEYRCISTEPDGRHFSSSFELEVYEPIYYIPSEEQLTKQVLITGTDSLIKCQARGHKEPFISWYKGDMEPLNNNDKYKIVPEGLFILNATTEDEGKYHCSASVVHTGEEVDTIINVKALTPPKIELLMPVNEESSVLNGSKLSIECKADGLPYPAFSWRKIDDNKNNSNDQTAVRWMQDNNIITFDVILKEDSGIYECIATNEAGESRQSIDIEVLSPPVITQFNNMTALEGLPVSVICGAEGWPLPSINVTFHGPEYDSPPLNGANTNITSAFYYASNFTFERVKKQHEGVYDCNATNPVGEDFQTIYLEVHYKPYFDVKEELVWGWEGQYVHLNCNFVSNPKADVQWYLGSSYLPIVTNITENQGPLEERQDTEAYVGLSSGREYEYYTCKAKNKYGEATKLFVVKRGHLPSILNFTDVNMTESTATSFTFSIERQIDLGPPVMGFFAEYDVLATYIYTDIHENRSWALNIPFKIEHLKPNTTYKFRFAAINAMGTGPLGPEYIFTTPEKSIPEPPFWDYAESSVTISAKDKKLKLKSPVDNGSPIDFYVIKIDCQKNITDGCKEIKVPPAPFISLDGLKNNASYEIEVVAHNSVGYSSPSRLEIIIDEVTEYVVATSMTAGGLIGISIMVVILCIVTMDLLLFCTMKKGMIASCVHKKKKKKKEGHLQPKEKKGLLKDNGETAGDTMKADNGHKEFEYNKSTGVITGKHSAV